MLPISLGFGCTLWTSLCISQPWWEITPGAGCSSAAAAWARQLAALMSEILIFNKKDPASAWAETLAVLGTVNLFIFRECLLSPSFLFSISWLTANSPQPNNPSTPPHSSAHTFITQMLTITASSDTEDFAGLQTKISSCFKRGDPESQLKNSTYSLNTAKSDQ